MEISDIVVIKFGKASIIGRVVFKGMGTVKVMTPFGNSIEAGLESAYRPTREEEEVLLSHERHVSSTKKPYNNILRYKDGEWRI